MATLSTIGQKTVGQTAVQFTADADAATAKLLNGVALYVVGTTASAKIYWGRSNAVTTTTGVPIGASGQIAPVDVNYVGDIWFISDTASQQLGYNVVGQTVTIS